MKAKEDAIKVSIKMGKKRTGVLSSLSRVLFLSYCY